MHKGLFIVIDGIDGSGKTTIAKSLKTIFEEKYQREVVNAVAVGGGCGIGRDIRKTLFSGEITPSANFETLCMLTCVQDCLENQIAPALAQDKIVIVDRFYTTTLAYQWYMRGNHWLKDLVYSLFINSKVPQPDTWLYCNLPYQIAHERIIGRPGYNYLDGETLQNREKMSLGFNTVFSMLNDEIAHMGHIEELDTSRSVEHTQAEVEKIAKMLFDLHLGGMKA